MAAMHEELSRITALLEDVSEESVGRKIVYFGLLNGQNVALGFSGWLKIVSATTTTTTMLIER